MKRWALAALLVAAAPALAAPQPERTRLALPGEVGAAAALPGGAGVVLATVTPDGAVDLWRLEMGGDGPRLRPERAGLGSLVKTGPDEAPAPGDLTLVADPAGGGAGALLLSAPGAVWRLAPAAAPVRLAGEPGFALVPAGESRLAPPGAAGPLVLARAGELLLADPSTGAPLARVPLPVEARQQPWGLELRSPPVRRPPSPIAGTVVVVGPQTMGERRLRTLLVDAAGTVVEAWSLLPAGERLGMSRLVDVDGQLMLAATTLPEGLFAKHRLRLYRLQPDRTRKGSSPVFSTELDVRHWFEPTVTAHDLDGDGRSELVLVEPRGLGGRELSVASFASLGGGRFASSARRVQLGEDSARWSYDGDVDGDGRDDLLRFASARLSLHRGQPGGRAGAVSAAPEWTVAMAGGAEQTTVSVGVGTNGGSATASEEGTRAAAQGGGERGGDAGHGADAEEEADEGFGPSRLAVADLDGDGRGEVLLWRTQDAGGSELTVLWQRGSGH